MSDDPGDWIPPDQQPIFRVVGRRNSAPTGIPSLQARAAMDSHLNYRTCVPKGVFFYRNHGEMTEHREDWTIQTALARQRQLQRQPKEAQRTDTERSRPANWEDLKQVITWLNDANVEYALVGGYAIAAHGITRVTEDIDIAVNPERANSVRWIVALSHMPGGAAKALEGEPDVFATGQTYALRVNDEYPIDVLPQVGRRPWGELSSYIETLDLDGVPLRVLTLEGLLRTKQGTHPKDVLDATAIRALIQARQAQTSGR